MPAEPSAQEPESLIQWLRQAIERKDQRISDVMNRNDKLQEWVMNEICLCVHVCIHYIHVYHVELVDIALYDI